MPRIVITAPFSYAHSGHRVVSYDKGEQELGEDVAECALKNGWAVTPKPAKPTETDAPPKPAEPTTAAEPSAADNGGDADEAPKAPVKAQKPKK